MFNQVFVKSFGRKSMKMYFINLDCFGRSPTLLVECWYWQRFGTI